MVACDVLPFRFAKDDFGLSSYTLGVACGQVFFALPRDLGPGLPRHELRQVSFYLVAVQHPCLARSGKASLAIAARLYLVLLFLLVLLRLRLIGVLVLLRLVGLALGISRPPHPQVAVAEQEAPRGTPFAADGGGALASAAL